MRPRKAQEVSRGVVLQRGTYRLVVEPTMVCNVASQDAISRMCGDNVCQTSFIFAWGTCRTVTDLACVETDESKPRKRGRHSKLGASGPPSDGASSQVQSVTQADAGPNQTPQLQTQSLPQQPNVTANQSSPPKSTPAKSSVVKALPTVRDHTTDQLSPEGDEYVPRERDEAGEQKISAQGHPLGGREYRIRTFFVPGRGDKLFMLATECARVLGYRDSYLLFNKNRSLFKIIATQPEKDDLISQEILPYSYRSRQIAIVTAKSMFRQFGSRVVQHGRRVRDDYWEAKARKQGFTEEDMAGEKRPGAAKARDAAAAESVNAGPPILGNQDIIYSNGPLNHPHGVHHFPPGNMPASIAPLPMIHLAPSEQDLRLRDYGSIPRPRQEMTGAPYQDRTQPIGSAEIISQAAQTADMNKAINQQRIIRARELDSHWAKKRETPVSTPKQAPGEPGPAENQSLQSPPMTSGSMPNPGQSTSYPNQNQPSQMMSPTYSQPAHHGNNPLASPVQRQPMRSASIHERPSGIPYGQSGPPQGSPYGYAQPSNLWGQPPPQPHQSPISAQHSGLPQYSPSSHHHPSHPSPSPHQPPQLHHPQSGSSVHGPGMGYSSIGGMGPGNYSSLGSQRSMYPQPGQPPHQYLQQTTAAQQAGMQGWAPAPPPSSQQPGQHQGQGWPGY
ncbi:MAG: hypothetical protein Q9184_002595 [Pyrenodesmia sp. 2 TL-2023]